METFREYEHCNLCPRACGVNRTRGELGICKATDEVKVARAALHFWEEPLISGTSGSGTIFFTGCSLQCMYCQNYKISRSTSVNEDCRHNAPTEITRNDNCTTIGTVMSSREIAYKMLSLQSEGALNINFVTPTHFAPTVRQAIQISREQGLHLPIVFNTSGYETVKEIEANKDYVDIYLTDFKYSDSELAKDLSSASDYPQVAIEAIHKMLDCVGSPVSDIFCGQERLVSGVIVRHLVLPGQIDNSIEAIRMLHTEFGDSIMLSIMNQYTPTISSHSESLSVMERSAIKNYPDLLRPLSNEEYEEVLCFADELYPKGYCYQDGDTCDESFIPEFR